MIRPFTGVSLVVLLSSVAIGQTAEVPPAFEIADVHPSARASNPYMTGGVLRGGRYDLRNATMLDLIQTAYGVDDVSKILGGPNWLNTDRFDIAAKAPPGTAPETVKLMLQTLLAERFKLAVHHDSRALPAFVLSMGKGKPKLKEADGSGSPGCQGQPQNSDPDQPRYNAVACHNLTMDGLAQNLREMASGYLTDPVVNQTGLAGSWDFDLKWSGRGQLALAGSNAISIFDAVDKQLGLKLEPQKVSMSVVVVDRVNQKPTDNPPGVTTKLPPPPPAQFEVAAIKPAAPGAPEGEARIQNGRVDLAGWSLKLLVRVAWNLNSDDMIAGAPKFMDSARFDVVAKAPTSQVDDDDLLLMLRALLVERFKIVTHTETRPVPAYTLTAVKPKLQKADPANRSECKNGPGADGKDPRIANPILSRLVTCHNTTMAQLADQFQNFANGYIHDSAVDATGIEGAFDFTLSFSGNGVFKNGGGRGGDAGASDPSGAISLFEAVNKQLGLKLELQKRPMPVVVIDHIEEKPTEN